LHQGYVIFLKDLLFVWRICYLSEGFVICLKDLFFVWRICYLSEGFVICLKDLLFVWRICYLTEGFVICLKDLLFDWRICYLPEGFVICLKDLLICLYIKHRSEIQSTPPEITFYQGFSSTITHQILQLEKNNKKYYWRTYNMLYLYNFVFDPSLVRLQHTVIETNMLHQVHTILYHKTFGQWQNLKLPYDIYFSTMYNNRIRTLPKFKFCFPESNIQAWLWLADKQQNFWSLQV